jgi:hypothetical protein
MVGNFPDKVGCSISLFFWKSIKHESADARANKGYAKTFGQKRPFRLRTGRKEKGERGKLIDVNANNK